MVSAGVGFTPAGTVADVYTAVTGKDAITGEEVSPFWRAAGLVPFVSELRKGAKAASNISDGLASKPLLGKNAKEKKGRTLTDLDPVHDRATAKSIFRNQTEGQEIRQFENSKGDIIRRSEDGTQIRMNPDGSTRLDLPGRGNQPNGETIHFNP